MARSTFFFVVAFVLVVAAIAFGRTYFGAEVGAHCNDFVLSCRATRGILTVNACVRTGPNDEDTFCSYACNVESDCPEGWSCDPAAAWSNVSSAAEDVRRACRPPHGSTATPGHP